MKRIHPIHPGRSPPLLLLRLGQCVLGAFMVTGCGDAANEPEGAEPLARPAALALSDDCLSGAKRCAIQVAHSFHACAVINDGSVACWGDNSYGQLGLGIAGTNSPLASRVPDLVDVVSVATGGEHTCALHGDGRVSCWGHNDRGQLGIGAAGDRYSPTSVVGLDGSGQLLSAVAITAASQATCALLADRRIACWGDDVDGVIGVGTYYPSLPPCLYDNDVGGYYCNAPVPVAGIDSAVQVACGSYHCTAILADGTARSWGSNYMGQLGTEDTTGSPSPVTILDPSGVGPLTDAVGLSAGGYHTCALSAAGTAMCWGENGSGQLGDGTTTNRSLPVDVANLSGLGHVGAGFVSTCAVLQRGGVACWGYGLDGDLGHGAFTTSPVPVPVVELNGDRLHRTASIDGSCAVTTDGKLHCWGRNTFGEVGDGTFTNRANPVRVIGVP